MHQVIPHQLHENVFVYLNDLLISSETLEQHFDLLNQVSERLIEAGLTIKVEKSHFLLKEVKYLGYIVGGGTLQVNADKVKAIVDYPKPKTGKQIRRFLGLCGWYRRFIRNFATMATPITDLLKKGKKTNWSEEAEQAFIF